MLRLQAEVKSLICPYNREMTLDYPPRPKVMEFSEVEVKAEEELVSE